MGTDRAGNKSVKFTVPTIIKQNQGGPGSTVGQRMMDNNPFINLYANKEDEFLCPIKWLQELDIYRAAAAANSKVPQSPNLFLQLGHLTGSKASSSSMAPYAEHFEKKVVFSNKLTNGALGKNALNPLIKALCRMAGIKERTNHGFGRRTFVVDCYKTRMPDVAIQRLSRHKSIAGVHAYAG